MVRVTKPEAYVEEMSETKPPRVSDADRAHMRKLGEAKRALAREAQPPADLREMLARMEQIARWHGELATPGSADDDGDLASHLAHLERRRALLARGT
jgi:hypothetical protein